MGGKGEIALLEWQLAVATTWPTWPRPRPPNLGTQRRGVALTWGPPAANEWALGEVNDWGVDQTRALQPCVSLWQPIRKGKGGA